MKSVIFLLAAALTTALVFLWACARLADMEQVSNAQAPPLVGSGPYTAFAKRPSAGSSGPYYSVAVTKDSSPNECGARLDIRWVAPGVFRTGVDYPYPRGPIPPELQGKQFQSLPSYQGVEVLATDHHGRVVGYCQSVGSGAWTQVQAHALLWTHGYRYDLNDCIPKHSRWLLVQATRIDDHGQIAGCGTFHGSARAFLLTPRRPTSRAPTRSCPPGRSATMVLTQHTPKRRHT